MCDIVLMEGLHIEEGLGSQSHIASGYKEIILTSRPGVFSAFFCTLQVGHQIALTFKCVSLDSYIVTWNSYLHI